MTDTDLYLRGAKTVLASWEAYARGSAGATVRRRPGVAAAVFPNGPERGVYNNAVLERGLAGGERAEAVDAMEAAYAGAGVTRFAAWVHESDAAMRRQLEQRGYELDLTTRAMGMALDEIRLPRPEIEPAPVDWPEVMRMFGLPPGLLSGADHAPFRLIAACLGGNRVAAATAFDCGSDRGIYNVGTLERARRHGLATALTAHLVHDALARGCRTATLQSTAMAERVYVAVGFRDLGRIFEYVPRVTNGRSAST
jgi:ribosomal protein S18 acetylase RimI-like enzyme